MTPPTPGVPQDGLSLTETLDQWSTEGYTGVFVVRAEGHLECRSCNARFSADAAEWDGHDRLEGASDPDDMLLVAAGRCPRCGASATVVLRYGPTASAEDADIVALLKF